MRSSYAKALAGKRGRIPGYMGRAELLPGGAMDSVPDMNGDELRGFVGDEPERLVPGWVPVRALVLGGAVFPGVSALT